MWKNSCSCFLALTREEAHRQSTGTSAVSLSAGPEGLLPLLEFFQAQFTPFIGVLQRCSESKWFIRKNRKSSKRLLWFKVWSFRTRLFELRVTASHKCSRWCNEPGQKIKYMTSGACLACEVVPSWVCRGESQKQSFGFEMLFTSIAHVKPVLSQSNFQNDNILIEFQS